MSKYQAGALLALVVLGVAAGMARAFMPATPQVKPEAHTPEQDMRLYMDKLGFRRWQMACVFATAKDGKTFERAEKNCDIDWSEVRHDR